MKKATFDMAAVFGILLIVCYWVTIVYVIYHFVTKYW